MRQILHTMNYTEAVDALRISLRLCLRFNPDYLFVAEYDHSTLTAEITLNNAYSSYPWRITASEFGYDENVGWPASRGPIRCLRSHASGSSVRVVALPGLEQGSVIVGFFR
jgi:hypothetical protein